MSAFIVSDDCMNRSVTAIMRARFKGRFVALTFGGVSLDADDAEQQIGALLYAMNKRAVDYRYDLLPEEPLPAWTFRWVEQSDISAHKALCCLIYQCSEGPVCLEPLYRELVDYKAQLAEDIVASLPEWEKAPWD